MSRILVFEDAVPEQQFLQSCLESRFETHILTDASNCIEKALELAPDLILMDLAIESINVMEAKLQLKKHQSTSKIPVLLLSTLQELSNKSGGLMNSRKDDFVLKPIQEHDLIAHIEGRLAYAADKSSHASRLRSGCLSLNPTRSEVVLQMPEYSAENRIQIHLNPAEFTLLKLFMGFEGKVFTRTDLQGQLCAESVAMPTGDGEVPRVVDTLIFQLRRKLKPVAHYFQTVYGQGYRFSPAPVVPHRR